MNSHSLEIYPAGDQDTKTDERLFYFVLSGQDVFGNMQLTLYIPLCSDATEKLTYYVGQISQYNIFNIPTEGFYQVSFTCYETDQVIKFQCKRSLSADLISYVVEFAQLFHAGSQQKSLEIYDDKHSKPTIKIDASPHEN